MSKKDKQHIVPRTYLKNWKISNTESFVWGYNLSDPYKSEIEKYGLNDKIFKSKKYYNDQRLVNTYAIEDFLGSEVEPTYNRIITEISQEGKVTEELIELIIMWLFFSKSRGSIQRKNIERINQFIAKYNLSKSGEEISESAMKSIKGKAKKVQLDTFIDNDKFQRILNLYRENCKGKEWVILKAQKDYFFWTNDNPGFSPNVNELAAQYKEFHFEIELNKSSQVYFPLSPMYCLWILPAEEKDSLNNDEILFSYHNASYSHMDYINRGTYLTSDKIVLSKEKATLNYQIKRK